MRWNTIGLLLLGCSFGLLSPALADESSSPAQIESVHKIWDQAPHNAFTDLVRFQDQWYCVFREGDGHVSDTGSLRVLRSSDGKAWESAALITADDSDLRDAKICVTPEGKLMLAGAGALHQPASAKHQTYVWYSDNGSNWSKAIAIGPPNYWIWRITWHDGAAYGVGYRTVKPRGAQLFKSDDGITFEAVGEHFAIDGYMNETGLIFHEDGTAMCLIRRDGSPNDALLGTAEPPYTNWQWKSLGTYVGGPQLIQLQDGRYIVGGRSRDGGAKTAIWQLDPQKPELTKLATLPSGGDTSYPGLVFHEGRLWVSYYSSHEGKTSIYLAKLKLPEQK